MFNVLTFDFHEVSGTNNSDRLFMYVTSFGISAGLSIQSIRRHPPPPMVIVPF